jgi:hypothetical protein
MFLPLCQLNLYIFQQILTPIAHNIPAVYDVGAGIKGLCEAKTRAGKMWVEGAVGGAADLGDWNPGVAEWRRSIYSPVMCSWAFLKYFLFLISFL